MYANVNPTVIVLCPADAISNAGTCRENTYFYHYGFKSHLKYDFLIHGDPIYHPLRYRFAQSPFNAEIILSRYETNLGSPENNYFRYRYYRFINQK